MFKRLDLVRLGNGNELIITGPPNLARPINPYSGVKPMGKGAQYKFGPKHNPRKVGTVTEDHPALVALAGRKGGATVSEPAKNAMVMFLRAIDRDDIHDIDEMGKRLAPFIRQLV